MKKYVILALLLAFLTTSSFASAASETFTRYLQKGDTGNDVTTLQKVLNTDEDTKISGSGDGSTGKETTFFGELTKQAVIKLQKKHNLGTKYGFFTIYSGALDDKTREFLNNYVEEKGISSTNCSGERNVDLSRLEFLKENFDPKNLNELYNISAGSNISGPYIEKVEIDSGNATKFTTGSEIKITGCNFATSTSNTVRLTFNSIQATSTDGTTIIFKAESALQTMFDEKTDDMSKKNREKTLEKIPELPVFITVQNEKGTSNPYQIYMNMK